MYKYSMSGQCLCLGHICSGRRAINESTIFRTIFQASQVATAYAFTFCIGVGRFRILGGPRFRIFLGGGAKEAKFPAGTGRRNDVDAT